MKTYLKLLFSLQEEYLTEIGEFLDSFTLPKLNQEDISNLNMHHKQ